MNLYSTATSIYCHRTRIVLAEKDITVDIIESESESLPEDLIDLNPYQSVPCLLDRKLVLYDARIIMEYLDERFPHPPLMPIDPVSRAHSRLALFRIEKDWFALTDDIEHGTPEEADAARNVLRQGVLSAADVFSVKPYFLSDDFSLVDCTISPILWRLPKYGIDLPEKQAKPVLEYMDRVFSRDTFQMSLTSAEKAIRP